MSQYDDLKEDSSHTFTGIRHSNTISSFIPIDKETYIIQGFPACPQCGAMLLRDFFKDRWVCAGCGTEWNRTEMVEALQDQRLTSELLDGIMNNEESDDEH